MSFTKTTLKNGLRILTVPMKGHSTATALVLVEAGSKYEDKKTNGISHFLEHMCFKGTSKRPSAFHITSELDGLGAQSNAFTGTEYTGYYAKAEHHKLPQLIDIISDIYLHSTFPEGEIEKEKGVVIEEMNMYEDLPHRKVHEVFEKLVYGDQPAGWPIIGTKKNIEQAKQKDLLNYRKSHYVASSTIVIIAGNFNEKKVIEMVSGAFKNVPTSAKKGKVKTKDVQIRPQVETVFRKTDQTHLVLGFRAYPVKDKKNYQASVLTTILGKGMSSRLFMKLREEMGLCYYIRAGLGSSTDHGIFSVSAGVGNSRTEEAVAAIVAELKNIKEFGITKEELTKAKDFMIGTLALDLESSDDFADYYGMQELYGEKILKPEEYAAKIKAVTLKQVNDIAKELLQKKTLNLALVGPFQSEKPFLSLLEL